jgi:hypothetical protein
MIPDPQKGTGHFENTTEAVTVPAGAKLVGDGHWHETGRSEHPDDRHLANEVPVVFNYQGEKTSRGVGASDRGGNARNYHGDKQEWLMLFHNAQYHLSHDGHVIGEGKPF